LSIIDTRIPVRAVVSFSEAGYSAEDILREYPTLTPADIEAALAFHAEKQACRPKARKRADVMALLEDLESRLAALEARIPPGPSPEQPAHMAEEIAESEAEATRRLR